MKPVYTIVSVIIATFALVFAMIAPVSAQENLAESLKGRILLSVEEKGEAWYVNPDDLQRYYLGRPEDAFQLMRELSLGITNENLNKIPFEGTDNSGDLQLRQRLSGKILLQVEENGEAWYVNPVNTQRYFLGRPADAFNLMRELGLGISVENLNKIAVSPNSPKPVYLNYPIVTPPIVVDEPIEDDMNDQDDFIDYEGSPSLYTNSEMGLEFTEGLFDGYVDFYKGHGHYPELKWFENILGYNLPIYFQENGFQLDPGTTNYFVWNNLSDEFMDFYWNHFDMTTSGSHILLAFDVVDEIDTSDHGVLVPGTYYISDREGFMNEEQFAQSTWSHGTGEITKAPQDAQRVVEAVEAVQAALKEYWVLVEGYPIAYERPIVLGENGADRLTENGFFGNAGDYHQILYPVPTGFPSTEIVYDSKLSGRDYVITFTLYGNADKYEAGKYIANQFGIQRIGNAE